MTVLLKYPSPPVMHDQCVTELIDRLLQRTVIR